MTVDTQRWIALPFWRRYLILCLNWFPVFTFMGCQWMDSERADHPHLTQAWTHQLDSLSRLKGVTYSVRHLDSLMKTLPKPGTGDQIKRLQLLRQLYEKDPAYTKKIYTSTDQLLSLFKDPLIQKKYPRDYAEALLFKGDDLLKQQRYADVYPYYFAGKLVLIEAGETCELSTYSRRIAMVSYGDEKYHQAIEYYKKEFEELQSCKPEDGFELTFVEKQGSLDNIGLSYRQLGNLDSALHYYDQALGFIQSHEKDYPDQKHFMTMAKVVVMSNQADAYLAKKDYPRAETILRNCIRINYALGTDIENAQYSQLSLIKLYLNSGKYSQARQELERLAESLTRRPSDGASFEYQRLSGAYYFQRSRYDSAAHYLMNYLTYQDQIEQQKRKGLRLDFSQSMAQTERDYENALTEQQDHLQRLSLSITILVAVAILVILFLMYRNWKAAHWNVRKLTRLNEKIARQNTVMKDTVQALEESQQQNYQLMKIVAHDLRNPVGAIHSAAQLLLHENTYTNEQVELLNLIQTASINATSLISQLLEVNLNANQTIQKEKIQLEGLLVSSINMLRHKAEAKQQTIVLECPKIYIPLDREKMFRVIGNLLGNAIKFSPPGKTIRIVVEDSAEQVLLQFEDQGIGIPATLQKNIFEFFTVAKRPGTSGEQPFGLGLAICRQIVAAHGGKIWFSSVENEGTQFFVQLPKSEVKKETPGKI